ncbi:MAG: hypothetical protein ACLR9P_02320 [Escherichia coli]
MMKITAQADPKACSLMTQQVVTLYRGEPRVHQPTLFISDSM